MTNPTPTTARVTAPIVLTPSLMERYLPRVDTADDGGCWNWNAYINSAGYGRISGTAPGSKYLAHRIAWTMVNGEIPAGMIICHSCDNRRCCNPAHLFVGTDRDNYEDMVTKGRATPGADHRAWNLRCKRDHLMTGDNVWVGKQGHRVCKACLRFRDRQYRYNPDAIPMAKRTHCPQGHPYDEVNTNRNSKGNRICRTCTRDRDRVRYLRKKAEAEQATA